MITKVQRLSAAHDRACMYLHRLERARSSKEAAIQRQRERVAALFRLYVEALVSESTTTGNAP